MGEGIAPSPTPAARGVFAVRREQIRFWSHAHWERLRSEFERCDEGRGQELSHYMERAWKAMLDVEWPRSGRQPLSPAHLVGAACPFV